MNKFIVFVMFVLLAFSSLSFAATRAEAEAAISAADLAIYTAQQAGKDTAAAEAKLLEATRKLTSDADAALNLAVEAKRLAETAPSATPAATPADTDTTDSQSADTPADTTPAPTTPAPAPASISDGAQAPAETVNIPAATGPAEEPASVGIDWLMVASLLLVPVVVLLVLFGAVWFFFLRKRY